MTSLTHLNLSLAGFQGKIPPQIGNLSNLMYLDLSFAANGTIPSQIGNLSNLLYLNLRTHSYEPLFAQNVDWLSSLSKLEYLDLGYTNLSKSFHWLQAVGSLSSLKHLYLRGCRLPLPHYSQPSALNFTSLLTLDMSDTSLFSFVPKWIFGLAKLVSLQLRGNNIQGPIPDGIQNLTLLQNLDLSENLLSSSILDGLYSLGHLKFLNLEYNNLNGSISNALGNLTSLVGLHLSYNQLEGKIPTSLGNLCNLREIVDLNTNHLCGKLPYLSNNVYWLDLSSNSFSGSMDDFLCKNLDKPMHLELLNLASNNLSGQIPDCWKIWPFLLDVNLQSNLFVGNLPPSIGSLAKLQFLQIRNNSLSGTLPTTLKKNIQLISLDLGENNLTGTIPMWVGERFINLRILGFRSNNFSGHIPNEICGMSHLQVLDLAHNKLSGNIPSCFNHLNAMTIMNKSTDPLIQTFDYSYSGSSIISMPLWLKGREDEYKSFLGLVTNIDLSNNKLSGEIPREITYLNELIFLNLSHNQLIGHIPQSIGNMKSIQTIDFSSNQLSGDIPPTISNLSFLSMLDLSYNHLKGKIPTGTQVQTFDASNFIGNKLCGPPLLINCSSIGKNPSYDHIGKESHRHEVKWFFVSMTFGFIMGFWIVIGPLLICKSWRYAYFDFLDHVWFKLQYYVDVVSLFNVVKSKIVM
uniref:LRR receptor-like serine/threonine-protein kinase FLS2 n=1 Tax=Cajanus cajan TaxID=3821 RepID=A0A151R7B3_CAJCA|nr:LRR receptor-like serine/threonine-protein kinase FLS2 [Cajanus cajan]